MEPWSRRACTISFLVLITLGKDLCIYINTPYCQLHLSLQTFNTVLGTNGYFNESYIYVTLFWEIS